MYLIKLILIVLLLAGSAEAKNLYVNNSGSPACSDSTTYANNDASNPWCTLLRAARGNSDGNRNTAGVSAQAAQAGDTVYVTAGTYMYDHETYLYSHSTYAIYEPVNDGSAGNWIKFEAVGTVNLTTNYIPTGTWYRASSCAPIIGGSGNSARYVWWHGFTINQQQICYRRGHGIVEISGAGGQVRITNNSILGTYTNYGEGDQHNGILIIGPNVSATCNGTISNLTISNNTIIGFTGFNHNDSGITAYCLGDNITIEHNNISSNASGIYGKSAYDASANVNIRYNLFANNVSAIRMQAFDSWYVYQNIFRDNSSSAYHIDCTPYSTSGTHPSDTKIVNNTMDNNYYALYFDSLCENLIGNYVRNNIVTNIGYSAIRSEEATCQSTANIGTDDIDFDYNVWGHSGSFWTNDGNQTVVATVAAFISTYSQGANQWSNIDCLFVNGAGDDFRLQAGSTCREGQAYAGIDILDLDNDGQTNDAITIGAYITGSECIGLESACASSQKISGGLIQGGRVQ